MLSVALPFGCDAQKYRYEDKQAQTRRVPCFPLVATFRLDNRHTYGKEQNDNKVSPFHQRRTICLSPLSAA